LAPLYGHVLLLSDKQFLRNTYCQVTSLNRAEHDLVKRFSTSVKWHLWICHLLLRAINCYQTCTISLPKFHSVL